MLKVTFPILSALIISSEGACSYDVCKTFGIFDPLPPCLHFGPIHGTKFTQPLLLHLLLGYPLLQTSYVHAPYEENEHFMITKSTEQTVEVKG